jgi:hypothetical protein
MFHMLAWAVKLADLRRSTLPKAIDSGQITGTKCLLVEEQVAHGELHQISPSLTESADENGTHISAARDAGALEAEIAALIKEARESLQGPPRDDHWVTERVALQPLPADPNEDHKCSAQPKNIDSKVKEDCLERRAWDPDIRISDLEGISNSLSNSLRPRTARRRRAARDFRHRMDFWTGPPTFQTSDFSSCGAENLSFASNSQF